VHRLVQGAQLLHELDKEKRAPTRRSGSTCYWCPLAANCSEGQEFLNGDREA